jgi:quinol monooxygenase YgiN
LSYDPANPNKEHTMAVAFVQEFPIEGDDRSTTNYDALNELIMASGVPAGLVSHSAGFDEEAGVFRIFDIWESQAQAERFLNETVMPAVQPALDAGAAPPARNAFYNLHNVVTP